MSPKRVEALPAISLKAQPVHQFWNQMGVGTRTFRPAGWLPSGAGPPGTGPLAGPAFAGNGPSAPPAAGSTGATARRGPRPSGARPAGAPLPPLFANYTFCTAPGGCGARWCPEGPGQLVVHRQVGHRVAVRAALAFLHNKLAPLLAGNGVAGVHDYPGLAA